MPKVDPDSGEMMSDEPQQADQDAAGGTQAHGHDKDPNAQAGGGQSGG